MKLLLNYVRKDYARNKVITTALTIFLLLSTVLMAGGLRVAGTVISSLNGLNALAMPPDYIQMHKGDIDRDQFDQFVDDKDYINQAIIVSMLNVNNSNIIYNGETFEKSLMDNGFIVQNIGFDLLLNTENLIASVNPGEIGVPVYYVESFGIDLGDIITLRVNDYQKDFIVSTFIRDASMNAALTSSKRFLVHADDLDILSQNMGEWEYMFEFLLKDGVSTSLLEKEYREANLPVNGVAITGSLLQLLNSLSYGLTAFIIIGISFLLITIAILCLSYIIQATLAEENYTIGEMKAIGIPSKSILNLYQIKYIFLLTIAILVGYVAAIPFGTYFSSSVILYCGNGKASWMIWLFPLIGLAILRVIVIVSLVRIIKKNLRLTVVELLRGEERIQKEGHYKLPRKGFLFRNLSIAFGELKCKWREYPVIFLVFMFSSFLILLPMNMRNTIEDPSFMTYMGVGESDIRVDLQYSTNIETERDGLISYLNNDSSIQNYAVYQYGYLEFQNEEGNTIFIRVENGNHNEFPLEYLEGVAPTSSNQIALSYLNAKELNKEVGDEIELTYHTEELMFRVSGIYQDITYGGKTAKANIDFIESDVEVYIIYIDYLENTNKSSKINELRGLLPNSKITPIDEFVAQTLGGINENMLMIEKASIAISLLLIGLITVMILQLITAREHRDVAIKKSIGFSNRDIRIQFGIRIFFLQAIAILLGSVLANDLGEVIFGLMLQAMGASKIVMIIDPVFSYIIFPVLQVSIVLITVILGTRVVKKYHIRDQILE